MLLFILNARMFVRAIQSRAVHFIDGSPKIDFQDQSKSGRERRDGASLSFVLLRKICSLKYPLWRVIVLTTASRMIRMSVRDHGVLDDAHRIDIKIAGLTEQTFAHQSLHRSLRINPSAW